MDKNKVHQTLLEEWHKAVDLGDLERAIDIDNFHYNELVKKNEQVAYWDRWQSETLPHRRRLTASISAQRPSLDVVDTGERRCLIVYHNCSGLAHETQFARNVAWLRDHDTPVNIEVAYLFGPDKGRHQAAKLFGIRPESVHYLKATSHLNAAELLDLLAAYLAPHSIIYPSLFFLAFWMSLFVPHPNQKFVQMKYYPWHTGRIKTWFGGYRNSETYYRINSCNFVQLPVLDLQLSKSPQLGQRAQIDQGAVQVGSISRPEKLTDQHYNSLILDLLARHRTVRYLYTGREDSRTLIPGATVLHERSVWLGWVDPISAIQQFDIYLEPFPWGGGDMSLLALEAARPYLTLSSKENLRFGIYSLIKYIADQGDPILQFSFCRNVLQLGQRLDLLVNDSDLRQKLGNAWRDAVLGYRPPDTNGWGQLFYG
jgi:hypothetical protein